MSQDPFNGPVVALIFFWTNIPLDQYSFGSILPCIDILAGESGCDPPVPADYHRQRRGKQITAQQVEDRRRYSAPPYLVHTNPKLCF